MPVENSREAIHKYHRRGDYLFIFDIYFYFTGWKNPATTKIAHSFTFQLCHERERYNVIYPRVFEILLLDAWCARAVFSFIALAVTNWPIKQNFGVCVCVFFLAVLLAHDTRVAVEDPLSHRRKTFLTSNTLLYSSLTIIALYGSFNSLYRSALRWWYIENRDVHQCPL